MNGVLAFSDEYGQPNLDTSIDNVSTHYIVGSIIVESDKEELQRTKLDLIRSKHFQKGPMKSATIGDNDERRIRILNELKNGDIHRLALVVDKDLIHKDSGLRYQRPFRRFLNRKLYEELYNTFPSLRLTADRVGKSDFMVKFKSFLEERHHLNTLFNSSVMQWGSARENVFLQAADVVCGSLGRCFDRKKQSVRWRELQSALTPWVQLRDWPWRESISTIKADTADTVVRNVAKQRVDAFIEKHNSNKDEDIRNQVSCLKYLLFYARYIDANDYVHAPEIIASTEIPRTMRLRQFQTRVIAKLRDANVLIASDSKGYKIPSTIKDVFDYLRWTNKQVEPMIIRAKRMSEAIQLASHNKIKLLEEGEFKYLRGPI